MTADSSTRKWRDGDYVTVPRAMFESLNESVAADEDLMRQALQALEWCEPAGTVGYGGIEARKMAMAALRRRLGDGNDR